MTPKSSSETKLGRWLKLLIKLQQERNLEVSKKTLCQFWQLYFLGYFYVLTKTRFEFSNLCLLSNPAIPYLYNLFVNVRICLSISFLLISSRLSYFFLPFARANSSLIKPRLVYIFTGINVKPDS